MGGLKQIEFTPVRRLVAWEYAEESSVGPTGIVYGPTPFGATAYTDYVPTGLGVQGFCQLRMRWATGARPGAGLRKLLIYPEFKVNYGGITPDGISDANKAIPVLAPDSNTRLSTVALGAAYADDTPVIPMAYKALGPAATMDVQMRIIALELGQVRYDVWRAEDPGSTYRQAIHWEERNWGQTPQTPRSGTTPELRQMPLERSGRYQIDWQGIIGDVPTKTELVFLPGDAITMLFCYGAPV